MSNKRLTFAKIIFRRCTLYHYPIFYLEYLPTILRPPTSGGSVWSSLQGSRTCCKPIRVRVSRRFAPISTDTETISRAKSYSTTNVRHPSARPSGILFQDLKIFPELTALENIELKNRLQAYKSEAEIDDMLRRLEISDKSRQPCGKLSWGQQQRVAIIRALCQPFDFLLLDEPISHIDDRMARIVAELIAEEVASRQAAVVVSSIGKELPITYDNILNL